MPISQLERRRNGSQRCLDFRELQRPTNGLLGPLQQRGGPAGLDQDEESVVLGLWRKLVVRADHQRRAVCPHGLHWPRGMLHVVPIAQGREEMGPVGVPSRKGLQSGYPQSRV